MCKALLKALETERGNARKLVISSVIRTIIEMVVKAAKHGLGHEFNHNYSNVVTWLKILNIKRFRSVMVVRTAFMITAAQHSS